MRAEVVQAFAEIMHALPAGLGELESHQVISALQSLAVYLSVEDELIQAIHDWRQRLPQTRNETGTNCPRPE